MNMHRGVRGGPQLVGAWYFGRQVAAQLLILMASLSSFAAAAANSKVFRYAFEIAETGFDPAEISDLYSSYIIANIFDTPLAYDYLARPVKLVPNTLAAMPEV